MINAFKNQDNSIIDLFSIVDDLVLQCPLAHINPIGKILSELLLQQLNLLTDIQVILMLYRYSSHTLNLIRIR